MVRRGDGRREIAEQDVGLLGRRRLVLTEAHGPLRRGRRGGHRPAGPEPFEEPSHLAEHVVGGHRPGHGEHEPVGRVCLPEPLEQARPRDPRDGRLLSARRQPIPPRAEERPREDAVGDLGGLVLEATDLGQEHPALPLDLVVREARLGGHLVEQPEEAWPVSRETPGPQLAVFLIGPALDPAPGVLGGARDLDSGSRPCPLEEHAPEEGRHPVQLRRLVRRTAPGQEGHGDDRGAPVLAHQHRQAVG